jgi:hypothetical protein
MTPQQRTRENLTARGYLVGTVEKKKKFPDKKHGPCRQCGHQPMIEISSDLWEIFDIVGIRPYLPYEPKALMEHREFRRPEVIFVQTTTRANHSTRRNKILSSMEAKLVLLSGARILLQSWEQSGEKGSKWEFKDEWITLDMYKQAVNYPNTVAELVEIKRKAKMPDLPPHSEIQFEGVKDEELPF